MSCTSDNFEGIDDISILQRNGYLSESPYENLLCPDFSSKEDGGPGLHITELGIMNEITGPNANYLAFLIRAKSVNNTYMEQMRVVGYASSTNIQPDNPEKHTFRYMKEIF